VKASVSLACAIGLITVAGSNSKQADAAAKAPAKHQQVKAPKAVDWFRVVSPTRAGGFVMGNPNAKAKLIEYGSLSCSHCRAFDEEGVPQLIGKYVKSGQLSWEFRNYVRDALDMSASLIARCNGAKSFFPLARAFYKDQPVWIAKIEAIPQAKIDQLQSLPPTREFLAMARVTGLQQWAAARGVPVARSSQCLVNQSRVSQLIQMHSDANSQYANFPGTPTFVLNGSILKKVATWDALEPAIQSALGGHG
jgi:protein-disulfide isomerase